MKKVIISTCLIFIVLSNLLSQDSVLIVPTLNWEKEIVLDSTEIPSCFVNSHLDGNVSHILDGDNGIYLLISNTHLYRPYSSYMLHMNWDGVVTNSVRISGPIYYHPILLTNYDDCFYLNAQFKEGEKINNELIVVDKNLNLLSNKTPPYVCEAKKINGLYFAFLFPDETEKMVFGEIRPDFDSIVNLVSTKDFHTANQILPLPISSHLIVDFNFASNGKNLASYVNNTVLKGPDHHDIQLYYFNQQHQLLWHRMLTSRSSLGWLEATDIAMADNGDICISGFSNDVVNFFGEEYFDTLPELKDIYVYSFIAVYTPEGKLKYLIFPDKYNYFTYNQDRYKIIDFTSKKVTLINTHQPSIVEYNLTRQTLCYKLLEIPNAKVKDPFKVQFISFGANRFMRIQILEGKLNTNQPAKYILEHYSY